MFTLDELDTFKLYTAVRLHFTTDFDFFESKGAAPPKTTTYAHLLKKKYHAAIVQLSKTYRAKQLRDYFVSNMLVDNGSYMFDVSAEGKRVYQDYIRRRDSRSYIFRQDINRICMETAKVGGKSIWDSTTVTNGQHPLLFRLFVGSYLSPESIAILGKLNDFVEDWDKKIAEPVLYPIVANQIKKFRPFVMIKDLSPYADHVKLASDEFF